MIKAKEKGLSLPDLLIGMVLAMIAILVAGKTLSVGMAYKSVSAAYSDADINAEAAISMIGRDLKTSGYGLTIDEVFTCTLRYYTNENGIDTVIEQALLPVEIETEAGENDSDVLRMAYSKSGTGLANTILTTGLSATSTASLVARERFGFKAGDVGLLAEGERCGTFEVTGLPTSGANYEIERVSSGTYTPTGAATAKAVSKNNPNGIGYAFTNQAKILNLGEGLVFSSYEIKTINGRQRLVASRLLEGVSDVPVAENIVSLKAMYGRDINGDGGVDEWVDDEPASISAWRNVLAIRVGVVARSEKSETAGTTCPPGSSSDDLPAGEVCPGAADAVELLMWKDSLPGGSEILGPTYTLSADERRFKHSKRVITVPLINQINGL